MVLFNIYDHDSIAISFKHFNFYVGALYGGLAAIQTFFTYFGAMVFNAIYKNTVQTNKRIYLMVIIALLIVALILSL